MTIFRVERLNINLNKEVRGKQKDREAGEEPNEAK
jgi:hypothetical protein